MKKRALVLLSAVIALCAAALPAYAQGTPSSAPSLCPGYGQASVKVAIQKLPSKVIAGASLPVTVRISNLKDYPLSDGMLLARIVSSEPDDKAFKGMAGSVFSRFVPVRGIFVGAGTSTQASFSLEVPSRLPAGSYIVEAVYVLSDSGLEDVDAGPYAGKANADSLPIVVESPFSDAFAYVDASTASTTQAADGTVSVSVDVVNPGKAAAVVPLLWSVYYNSAVSEKTSISSEAETIKIPPSGMMRVSHLISDYSHASYETIVQAMASGISSFGAIRADYVRGEAVVNLLGIAPAGAGHQAFACVSNAFTDDAAGREVSLAVTDGAGTVLANRSFPVATSTNEMEFSFPFEMRGSGDVVLAAGIVSKDGAKQYLEKVFRCIDLGTCPVQKLPELGDYPFFEIAMIAAGLGGLIAVIFRPKKKTRSVTRKS